MKGVVASGTHSRTALILLALASFSFPAVFAQQAESNDVADASTPAREIEEITVIAEQTFSTLRVQIEAAEEEVFALFNELNSSDEYDITCTVEVYTGSHLPQRDCMAAFLRDAIAQNIQDYVQGIDVQLTHDQVESTVYEKAVELEAEMTRLILTNESLYQAMEKLTRLVGALETKRRR